MNSPQKQIHATIHGYLERYTGAAAPASGREEATEPDPLGALAAARLFSRFTNVPFTASITPVIVGAAPSGFACRRIGD